MRPKSGALRYAYLAAAAKLQSEKKDVTTRSLADEIGEDPWAVYRYLYRNGDIAREIGAVVTHVKHDERDYATVILGIPTHLRPTCRRIGSALGIDHSSVAKFLKDHPELKMLHPRFERSIDVPDEPEESDEREDGAWQDREEENVMRTWRDMYVNVWHERSGRYVGEVVTREQYLSYWEQGLLKHLHERLPKPEHLPTPKEVEKMA